MDDHRAMSPRARRFGDLGTLALVMLLVVTACGATPTPSATVAPGSSGDSTIPAGSVSPSTGADGGAAAAVPTEPVGQAEIDAFEDALAAEVVDAAGLEAVLGEERWSWAEVELRAAIADAASDAGVATGPPRLAMAGVAVDGPIAVETGGTGLAIGLALGVALTIGDSGSPTIGRDGLTAESTTERTENGERTTARITGTIGVPAGEGTISADVQFGVEVSVFDAATGALKSTTSFSTTGTVKIETCPDVNGKVHGHVSLAVSGSAGGASASVTVEADVVGTVDDSATLTTLDLDGTTTDSTTSASGVTTGSTASGGGRLLVGRGGSLTPDDSRAHGTLERDTADLTDDQVTDRYRRIGAAAGLAAFLIGGKAQEKWRGGKCVEIRLTEQSRGVKRNQHVPFEASVWHKIEQRQLTKPIVAAFAGEASVDPVDVAHPSPVTYDFKASSTAKKTGTITMTTTSNRGIGVSDIQFTTEEDGWTIDQASGGGRIKGKKCGSPGGAWVANGTYVVLTAKGKQHWEFTIDEATMRGTYVYSDVQTMKVQGITVRTVGAVVGTVTLTIRDDGDATMDLAETAHSFFSTTSVGGRGEDQNAPLQTSTMIWSAGADCPVP